MSFEFVEKLNFDSEFFSLYKLSDGVFAAICKESSGMGSNAGFIDLGDFSLMIDTSLSTKAAEDLKRASINFTGKTPKVVIITHYHLDHVIGNNIFDPSTLIITSDRTLNTIKTENQKRIEELKNMPQEEILKMEKSLETERDDEKRQDIENDLKFIRSIQAEDFSSRDPNLTFKEELIIYGKTRKVFLRTFKKAHTDGDVIIYIPNQKILYSGDLLFARSDPWLGSGDPEGWKSVIDDILELDFKIVIPGHGELASKKEFSLQKDYITEIVDLVKKQVKSGKDSIMLKRADLSPEFQEWKSPILEWNVNFLVEFLRKP
ncbi:MAG: MBL fold metallo-hydrolase [Promethearchaeota archaeon]